MFKPRTKCSTEKMIQGVWKMFDYGREALLTVNIFIHELLRRKWGSTGFSACVVQTWPNEVKGAVNASSSHLREGIYSISADPFAILPKVI